VSTASAFDRQSAKQWSARLAIPPRVSVGISHWPPKKPHVSKQGERMQSPSLSSPLFKPFRFHDLLRAIFIFRSDHCPCRVVDDALGGPLQTYRCLPRREQPLESIQPGGLLTAATTPSSEDVTAMMRRDSHITLPRSGVISNAPGALSLGPPPPHKEVAARTGGGVRLMMSIVANRKPDVTSTGDFTVQSECISGRVTLDPRALCLLRVGGVRNIARGNCGCRQNDFGVQPLSGPVVRLRLFSQSPCLFSTKLGTLAIRGTHC